MMSEEEKQDGKVDDSGVARGGAKAPGPLAPG
jgi:hypothetical protein